MDVFWAVVRSIARMRCAECQQIMNQGERERNPYTADGQPIHHACKDKKDAKEPSTP